LYLLTPHMKEHATIRIAIADDHLPIRQGITKIIADMNMDCMVIIEAADGRELLDKIAAATIQPDICFVDIGMEGMNGYDTMVALTKDYPFIKGIGLSLYLDKYHILNMIKCGSRGYISKNFSAEELKRAILVLYEDGFFLSADIKKYYPDLTEKTAPDMIKKLPDEKEIRYMELLTEDKSHKEIANNMHLSIRTVEHAAEKIKEKLEVNSRIEIAVYAIKAGIGKFFQNKFR